MTQRNESWSECLARVDWLRAVALTGLMLALVGLPINAALGRIPWALIDMGLIGVFIYLLRSEG